MDEYRVPLREVRVRIRLSEGEELGGTLYASATGPGGDPGRLIDRLNDDDPFLPWAEGEQGALLNKSGIVWVRVGPNEPTEDPGSEDDSHGARVSLDVSGGIHVAGEVHFVMPPGRSRVLDFINAAPRFIALRSESGTVLINRDHIVRIHER